MTIHDLETIIGVSFTKKALLQNALVHRSYVNENRNLRYANNERLEYLGDAVLELIITDYLFHAYPSSEEGDMTNMRSALVRKENLAKVGRKLELGKYLMLSHGEEYSGGREKDYLIANTLEAIIGAIYVDQGIAICHTFIHTHIIPAIADILTNNLHIDAKSAFQELTQETLKITPTYRVIEDSGPDHNKVFIMGVYLGEKLIAKGKGPSKRKAEEEAAMKALKKKEFMEPQ